MNARSRLVLLVALAVAVAMPLVGLIGPASATAATHCHKTHSCHKGSGGAAAGTPPDIIVSVSPDPVQEAGSSDIWAVVQVEALATFAGQKVNVSSQQLFNTCQQMNISYFTGMNTISGGVNGVILDNDGNATVIVSGHDCVPGPSLIEADLAGAPYSTATTDLNVAPPAPTAAPTVTGFPNPEVETGDGGPSGPESQVTAVFLVEENPVYAEQTVDVTSAQLVNRCGLSAGFTAFGDQIVGFIPNGIVVNLDNDGNALLLFQGTSCAAGDSTVVADLTVGTHDTFTTVYTIKPPQVTDI